MSVKAAGAERTASLLTGERRRERIGGVGMAGASPFLPRAQLWRHLPRSMDDRPPSLRELAAKLGVSHATVSMALRNHPAISPETRERVQALARKLNYRGNILVSALLTQVRRRRLNASGEVIGLLTEEAKGQHAPRPAEGIEAARERARQTGLRLEVFSLGPLGRDSAHVGRVLHSRGVRGLILAPMPTKLSPLEIDWSRHAVVAVGYSFQQAAMHRVANAHFNGLLECHRRLREMGRERIGCMLGFDEDRRSMHYWQAAARSAPHVSGGKMIPPLMLEAGDGRDCFERWLTRHRLDAVIGPHPDHAVKWLREMGVDVPGDVAYASLDLLSGAATAGILQSWERIYCTAVDQLAGELARNEFGLPEAPKITLIDGIWVPGETAARSERSRKLSVRKRTGGHAHWRGVVARARGRT